MTILRLVNERLTSNIALKTKESFQRVSKSFNYIIQCAGCNTASDHKRILKAYDCPITIKQKLKKRRLSRELHQVFPAKTYTYRIHGLFPLESDQRSNAC
jgi:hypothetical protein